MSENLEETGLAAVDRFITTWNSRDAKAWAGSLHFPHVRPSPVGKIEVAEDAAEYIKRVDYDRVIATGWDHSEWDFRHVLHSSPNKIHVVGQWSRYTKAGEKFVTNPVVYIVTRIGNNWGIQSRFSADYAGDEDTSSMESRGFKLLQTFVNHLNAGNKDACAELLNYPHFNVMAGALERSNDAAEFKLPEGSVTIDGMVGLQTGRLSINVGLDVTVAGLDGPRPMQGVLNVTERDGHLGIQAWSFLDPNAVED